MENKKKTVLITLTITILLLGLVAGTYAFFTTTLNNNNPQNVAATTINGLSLRLKDEGQTGISGQISPSNLKFETYSSIENEDQKPQYVNILFKNLTNTYSSDLVYTLEEIDAIPTNESTTPTVITTHVNKVRVPANKTGTPTNKNLAEGILINAGSRSNTRAIVPNTQYYRLTITYLYSTTKNQSVDLNASYYTELDMELSTMINFDTGEGHNRIASISKKALVSLPVAYEDGYGITGWYTDQSYTNRVTNVNNINSTTTLYAKWENDYALYNPSGNSYTWQELLDSNVVTVSGTTLTDIDYGYLDSELGFNTFVIDSSIKNINLTSSSYFDSDRLIIPDGVETIEKPSEDSWNVTILEAPTSLQDIDENTFLGVKYLIYNGSIGTSADKWGAEYRNPYIEGDFIYTDNSKETLTKYLGISTDVTVPEGVVTIEGLCVYLRNVTLPDTVEVIGEGVFYDADLKTINIPDSVTTIGVQAFQGSSLESIVIPNSVEIINAYAFANTKLKNITIGSGLRTIGEFAFNDTRSLETVTINPNNPYYDSRNNSNAIIETSTNKLIQGSSNTIIPNTVATIDDQAFKFLDISSLTIPSSVTKINPNIFGYGQDDSDYYPEYQNKQIDVTFENPSNWQVSLYGGTNIPISSEDLSNATTAGNYLKNTYYNYTWQQS